MLPDFPKFRRELDGYTMLKLYAMVQQKEPILAEIRGITQHEGDIIAYDQPTSDGVKIVTEAFKESRIPFQTNIEDVPTLKGAALDAKLSGIAEDIARDLSCGLRATLDTTTRDNVRWNASELGAIARSRYGTTRGDALTDLFQA